MRKKTCTPLEHLRRTRTLNQQQVAAVLGISQQHYSKIERGLMPASAGVKARLAALLGVSVHDIFPSQEAVAS